MTDSPAPTSVLWTRCVVRGRWPLGSVAFWRRLRWHCDADGMVSDAAQRINFQDVTQVSMTQGSQLTITTRSSAVRFRGPHLTNWRHWIRQKTVVGQTLDELIDDAVDEQQCLTAPHTNTDVVRRSSDDDPVTLDLTTEGWGWVWAAACCDDALN